MRAPLALALCLPLLAAACARADARPTRGTAAMAPPPRTTAAASPAPTPVGATATVPPAPTPAGATATAPPATDCSPARPHAPGQSDASLQSGGIARPYLLHVPPGYTGARAMPLVFVLHGDSSDAQFMVDYTHFDAVADAAGFIAAYPNATGSPQHWDTDTSAAQSADGAFLRELAAALGRELCIDPQRLYLAGYSNGGGMAQRIACDAPAPFAAVALVGGAYLGCAGHLPVIAFNGTEDAFVPYDGVASADPSVAAPPVATVIGGWAAALGCAAVPSTLQPAPDVELSYYIGCAGGDGAAQLYTVTGGGHTWPGSAYAIERLGSTSKEIDASAVIWGFFFAHPRRPASGAAQLRPGARSP